MTESGWPSSGELRSPDRLWTMFVHARLAVALVLALLQGVFWLLGHSRSGVGLLVCAVHLGSAWAVWRYWPRLRGVKWPWMPTVGMDGLVFAALQLLQPSGLNHSLLFALPVLMAASLGPQRRALATAASTTLFLLGDATWRTWESGDDGSARYLQTAIAGTGYFLMAVLTHQLAVRLARQEALAETSQQAARTQAEVNELVIDALNDGVLVVDRSLRIWAANPAARRLLGSPWNRADSPHNSPSLEVPIAHRLDQPEHAPLVMVILRTLTDQQALAEDLAWTPPQQPTQRLRVRTQPIRQHNPGNSGPACVVFLDDLHELEARVRAEKLASMGRMTVAVAHEIRNPLAAISQATQLLQEDLTDPAQQRLGLMIEQNTARLNRIVEDVLNVVRLPGRAAPGHFQPVPLDAVVDGVVKEWCGHHACTTRLRQTLNAPGAWVRFDPEHLRRVLVNLLDNAHRYASMGAGAIDLSTRIETPSDLGAPASRSGSPAAGPLAVRLSVWSDGAPLEPGILRHLFEPFFSSESRSSGMGLYLCRELCDRYQSRLDYQRSNRGDQPGNEFFLSMPLVAEPQP